MTGTSFDFDVWGARGSRSMTPSRSRIANYTSCYSLSDGEDVLTLDAGRGLAALGYAFNTQDRFRKVKRVHVFVTHAHMDHWEGLKDVDWFWNPDNGLRVTLYGSTEAVIAIQSVFRHPSYVTLQQLAEATLGRFQVRQLDPLKDYRVKKWKIRTYLLHHYSGGHRSRNMLQTLGYRVSIPAGPTVSYLSDHEPIPSTLSLELAMIKNSHMVVCDANFPDRVQQKYGHGSQEHTAYLAELNPQPLVLAGHHGPAFSDKELLESFRRHGKGRPNFQLAVEGTTYRWDNQQQRFQRR